MNGYETLIILKARGTEQDIAREASQIEEQIRKLGGSIQQVQSLGRRRLAFRIGRQAEGHYHLVRFQAPAQQVGELDRLFRLNEAIVRFVILSAEDGAPPAQPGADAQSGRQASAGAAGASSAPSPAASAQTS